MEAGGEERGRLQGWIQLIGGGPWMQGVGGGVRMTPGSGTSATGQDGGGQRSRARQVGIKEGTALLSLRAGPAKVGEVGRGSPLL